jgi:hypothetical protein
LILLAFIGTAEAVPFQNRSTVKKKTLYTAPHFTKMVKSSMFATYFGLNHLAILTALQLPFFGFLQHNDELFGMSSCPVF